MFSKAELLVLNKIHLLPYVNFDLPQARANALRVHPEIQIIELSCTTGQGFELDELAPAAAGVGQGPLKQWSVASGQWPVKALKMITANQPPVCQ